MCTKLLLLIATLYVVNGSVISHDAYDVVGIFADGKIDNEAEESQLYLNGALVKELSGVGMTFNSEAEESELDLNDEVEDIEARFAKLSSDLEELSEKRRCFPRICNRICRLRRFGNGTCIEGRCKCSNKVNETLTADESLNNEFEESKLKLHEGAEDIETNVVEYFLNPTNLSEKRRCLPRLCDIFCRLKRRGNGTCVDGQCQCSRRGEQSFVDDLPDNSVEESDLSINKVEDVAYNKMAEEPDLNSEAVVEDAETDIAAFFSDPKDLFVKRRCSPRRCNRLCRRKRYAKGTCVRGRCKCENEVPEYTTKPYTTEAPEDFITTTPYGDYYT